jgi:DNA-binding HxlR family transcriptional regulator
MNKTIIAGVVCPLERTVEIIGDRWSALILRELFLKGPRRFQDLNEGLPSVSPNILSGRLKKLLLHDILITEQYSDHPPRYAYHLTAKGKELGSIMKGMRDWGDKHTTEKQAVLNKATNKSV